MVDHFGDRLVEQIRKFRSFLCLGIDPHLDLIPKIFNENDNLVYGPRHYTRSRSVNRGPMGYAHSMKDGNVVRRVGKNPIIIEAISSDDKVNLTISNSDAEKNRDVEKKFGLLTNCKVLVLLK